MTMPSKVNFADEPALGCFGNVDDESDDHQDVHPDDSWNENLKKMTS